MVRKATAKRLYVAMAKEERLISAYEVCDGDERLAYALIEEKIVEDYHDAEAHFYLVSDFGNYSATFNGYMGEFVDYLSHRDDKIDEIIEALCEKHDPGEMLEDAMFFYAGYVLPALIRQFKVEVTGGHPIKKKKSVEEVAS